MENKETTALIEAVETKKTAAGKTYWVVKTDIGNISTFDDKLKDSISNYVGKKVKIGYQLTDKGFMNLKSIDTATLPEEKIEDKEDDKLEARKAKDVCVYTSYAKDIFVEYMAKNPDVMKDEMLAKTSMLCCCELIKQAREAFNTQ